MSTTTMHFGPEWMRTKHQPTSRPQHPPSPPPTNGMPASASGTSTYSSLVSAAPLPPSDKTDNAHPFRYSKDELLAIYHEGGGKGGLGIEVERWDGVVREVAADPITLREMTEAEKKLFAGSLNSEMRRRPSQSTDFLSPLNTSVERPRMIHSASTSASSPMRERFGGLKRRDSSGGTPELSSLPIPRKPSISAVQSPGGMHSPRDTAPPRTRVGYTPNFDGVLNNSESWVARRRASEASMKAPTARDGTNLDQAPMSTGIREEKEEEPPLTTQHVNGEGHSSLPSSSPDYHSATGSAAFVANGVDQSIAGGVSFGQANERSEVGPPPGLLDLNAVEWSYKDPTGQTQGPFSAEIMHSWHKGGYFTPDLPMKRTHLDTQWITLQELISQATSDNIFLTPPMPIPPPGLNRASPIRNYSNPEQPYSEPYQPAPLRTLRTSALENFIGGAESPSSSFGTSQFGNSSPDPSAFGGRDHRTYFGNDVNGRPGFGVPNSHPSSYNNNALSGMDYNHELAGTVQTSSYNEGFLDHSMNGHTSNNPIGITRDPWTMSSGLQTFGIGLPTSGLPSSHLEQQGVFGQDMMGRTFSQNSNGAFTESLHQHQGPIQLNPLSNPLGYANQFDPSAGSPYGPVQDHGQQFSNHLQDLSHSQQPTSTFGVLPQEAISSHTTQPLSDSFTTVPPQSPWNTIPDPILKVALTVVDEPRPIQPQLDEVSSTIAHAPDEPKAAALSKPEAQSPSDLSDAMNEGLSLDDSGSQTAAVSAATSEVSATTAPESTKRSKKSKASSRPSVEIVAPAEQPPSQPKSAWAKEEDTKKKKGTNASVSLREIQEAEAKKQESRKAAEREKERARAVGPNVEIKEEAQSFTTAWGLPTSQAGTRTGAPLSARDPPTPSPSTTTTPATPVWAAPPKTPAVKKSMKEIQEEEEKRKKQAAAKESAMAAAQRRAYAETMAKNTPTTTPAISTNTVWTTVGANGKTAAAAAAAAAATAPTAVGVAALPARPPPPSATVSFNRVTSTPVQRPATSTALKSRPQTKSEEVSVTPSHDFLKWLGDSLKGLNKTVNVEEIMSMLLSFPVDADSSTQEIISDTIYANSTTLDGRRFASEFVAKRKADAATHPKGGPSQSSKTSTKPVSIAEVVKSVPKPAQPEWGFKVVNKKKKGGRS